MIGRLEQCPLFVLEPQLSSLANCSLTGPTLRKTDLGLFIAHLLQTIMFNKPFKELLHETSPVFLSLATCIIFYYCIILMSNIGYLWFSL